MRKSEQVRYQLFLPRVLADRFAAFVRRVGQQLASGRITFLPEEPR